MGEYEDKVIRLETRLTIFLDEQFPVFQESITAGFADLNDKIEHISPNGQTPRLINMGKALGDPEQIAVLAEIVESRQRRSWLLAPFRAMQPRLVNALIWGIGGGLLAWVATQAHDWAHHVAPTLFP
jgi:hypothetical protein